MDIILPLFDSGPLYESLTNKLSDKCSKNFLYNTFHLTNLQNRFEIVSRRFLRFFQNLGPNRLLLLVRYSFMELQRRVATLLGSCFNYLFVQKVHSSWSASQRLFNFLRLLLRNNFGLHPEHPNISVSLPLQNDVGRNNNCLWFLAFIFSISDTDNFLKYYFRTLPHSWSYLCATFFSVSVLKNWVSVISPVN